MPCHPERVRSAGLPEGYQFGDGAIALTSGERVFLSAVFSAIDRGIAAGPIIAPEWRRPSDNAAARLTSAAFRITQAQLASERGCTQYGEFYVPGGFPHDGDAASDEIPPRADDVWDQQPIPERGWNVIEGDSH